MPPFKVSIKENLAGRTIIWYESRPKGSNDSYGFTRQDLIKACIAMNPGDPIVAWGVVQEMDIREYLEVLKCYEQMERDKAKHQR